LLLLLNDVTSLSRIVDVLHCSRNQYFREIMVTVLMRFEGHGEQAGGMRSQALCVGHSGPASWLPQAPAFSGFAADLYHADATCFIDDRTQPKREKFWIP
jgi:hypothetical protein